MKQVDIDEIYKRMSQKEIPWNREKPPKALVDLLEEGKVRPCTAVDFGCGTGNYAIYLARKGFDVTGIDISPTAIRIATEKAKKRGVRCNFIIADVLGDLKEVTETFDFAYDWELLHHIFPEQRKRYLKNVYRKLHAKGHYLSVCFSEVDPSFSGSGKYRKTPLGTILYFSTEGELRDLFTSHFHIEELRTIQISGRPVPHLAIYAFMERR